MGSPDRATEQTTARAIAGAHPPAIDLDRVCAVIDQTVPASACCAHCEAEGCHRHGHHRGLQRYRCRICRKTFTGLTGTPMARLRHRAKWLPCLDRMPDSTSVRAAAKAVGVHRNTSFRWRHRFLHLSKHDRPASLSGIAEADELFLLESQKGARQLDHRRFRSGWRVSMVCHPVSCPTTRAGAGPSMASASIRRRRCCEQHWVVSTRNGDSAIDLHTGRRGLAPGRR